MNAQIITNHGKPAFAVLPIGEYERLCALAEDHIDVAKATRLAARINAGEEETFSAAFVAQMTAGKLHPLRLWRQHRGLSLATLGEACGVSRSALSQIENRKTRPSTALLRKLADALHCDMDDLG